MRYKYNTQCINGTSRLLQFFWDVIYKLKLLCCMTEDHFVFSVATDRLTTSTLRNWIAITWSLCIQRETYETMKSLKAPPLYPWELKNIYIYLFIYNFSNALVYMLQIASDCTSVCAIKLRLSHISTNLFSYDILLLLSWATIIFIIVELSHNHYNNE